jgi:hypothetical protein
MYFLNLVKSLVLMDGEQAAIIQPTTGNEEGSFLSEEQKKNHVLYALGLKKYFPNLVKSMVLMDGGQATIIRPTTGNEEGSFLSEEQKKTMYCTH